jgi:hypothetical protein
MKTYKKFLSTDELIDKFLEMSASENIEWIKKYPHDTARMLWYLIGYCGKDKEEK